MDFTLIVIFLAFTSVILISNTLMIWFAYKGFANVTLKLTESAREFETNRDTREWIAALGKASEQAVIVTEATKQKMADLEPLLDDAQARYGFMLAKLDTRMERLTNTLSDKAVRVRDAVTKPAQKFGSVMEGVQNTLGFLAPSNGDEDED